MYLYQPTRFAAVPDRTPIAIGRKAGAAEIPDVLGVSFTERLRVDGYSQYRARLNVIATGLTTGTQLRGRLSTLEDPDPTDPADWVTSDVSTILTPATGPTAWVTHDFPKGTRWLSFDIRRLLGVNAVDTSVVIEVLRECTCPTVHARGC